MEVIVKRAARGHRARPFFCAPDPSPTPPGTHAPRSFLTIFVLCALAFHLPLSLAPDALFGPLSRFTAAVVGDLLRWLGQPAVVAGDAIRVGPFKARVIGECLALQPMALYAAFAVAFPARWREKGASLAGGVALLQGLNIVRITLLIWIGVTAPALFGPSHIYLGQMVMIAAVLGLALGWCRRTGPVNERPQRPSLNYLSRFLFFTSPIKFPYSFLVLSLFDGELTKNYLFANRRLIIVR